MTSSLLERARTGDARAFAELTTPLRRELHVHCYRMLGSLDDADDAVQDVMWSAWRELRWFEGRSSVRTWLYRIATNRCLNIIRDGRRRPVTVPTPPFTPPVPTAHGDVAWLQPYPDALLAGMPDRAPGPDARHAMRESLELAFITALQRLPPRQLAVLLLRDVLGFSLTEAAAILDVTGVAAKGTLQRARENLRRGTAGHTRHRDVPEDLARRFAEAFAADDVDAVVALLTDGAWLAMPPAPHLYRGPRAIGEFLRASAYWRRNRHFRLIPTRANGQTGYVCILDPADGASRYTGVIVLTAAADRIGGITHFLGDGIGSRFPTETAA